MQHTVSKLPESQMPVSVATHGMWEFYSKIMAKPRNEQLAASVEEELQAYLEDPVISPSADIFNFWNENQRFSNLKRLAKKYLSIPPSTVYSERLFSTAGLIVDKKRNRLDPEKVRMLVFLNKNL